MSRPVLEDPSSPLDWKLQMWMLSSIFFCLPFLEFPGGELWMLWPLPQYALILALCTTLLTAVFFLGPALAVHASGKSLTGAVALSVGSIPAEGVRACCVGVLVLWIADLLGRSLYAVINATSLRGPDWVVGCLAVAVLGFLFVTAFQSPLVSGKMAFLSTKLGLAILMAALFRVGDGWPAIQHGFANQGEFAGPRVVWRGFALLVATLAPLALIAAGWGSRIQGRKPIAYAASFGWAMPLFVAMLLVGVVKVSVGSSEFYQPSLQPSVTMALWAKSARSGVPPRVLIASLTVFGALRFGVRGFADLAAIASRGLRGKCLSIAAAILLMAGLCLFPWNEHLSKLRTATSYVLAVTAMVLTADLLVRRGKNRSERRFDWGGCVAMLAGLASPWYLPLWFVGPVDDSWWHRSILPACGVAFVACILSRGLEKLSRKVRHGVERAPLA
ncbi:MAG: hypothetical protein J0H49_20210 [Acidobacteria bacterium]|nr:hypothetical protein [Acidobacteriota bacterium]